MVSRLAAPAVEALEFAGQSVSTLLLLVVLNVVLICLAALTVGVPAPRWPQRWLDHDGWLLRVRDFETARFYRRLGSAWLVRVLPEGGSWTGGTSKSALYGADAASLQHYLIEVRRAEWVHVLMSFAWLPLVFFNPVWLWLMFAVLVVAVNVPFLIVLRFNHVRLTRLVMRVAPASGPLPGAGTTGQRSRVRHDDGVIAEPDHL